MAAVMYEQNNNVAGGTSSTTPNSSNSSIGSSTNFRCSDSISSANTVSLAAAYAAASTTYPTPPSSSSSISSNGNNKTAHLHSQHHLSTNMNSHHHTGQHLYSPTNDYSPSSITPTNGYWPYSTPQSYFPATTRQYMVNQLPPSSCPLTSTGVSDTSSTSSLQTDLSSYHPHGSSYPHMQKMVATYPNSYEFYHQHNAKYC